MSPAGVNMATTQNGDKYNKLKRPDDAPASAPHPAAIVPAPLPSIQPAKRTFDEAGLTDTGTDEEPHSKRTRVPNGVSKTASQHTPPLFKAGATNVWRPFNMQCGMQSMFPGMVDDEYLSDESTNEALAYLRSVRSEASSIPQLLLAPTKPPNENESDRSMYDNGRGDTRAVYVDGTWIARNPRPAEYKSETSVGLPDDLDPQEQYYKKLLWRLEALRKTFGDGTPNMLPKAGQRTSENIAVQVPRGRHEWLYILDREYPSPALVAQLNESDIFRGLNYCTNSLDRFKHMTKQKSCWIWTLLAKSPDSGVLDYSRIGTIRELGQKAGELGLRLRHGSGVKESPHIAEEEEEATISEQDWVMDGEGVDEDEESASADEESAIKPAETIQANSINTGNEENTAEEGEVESATEDDKAAPPNAPSPKPETNEHSDAESGAEMSMSEDDTPDIEKPTALEEARARLLAQLGDRFVPPRPDAQPSPPPQRGPRHRHNGEYCFKISCSPAARKQRQQQQRGGPKGGISRNTRSDSPPRVRPLPSRAEAEAQRQKLRDQELRKPHVEDETEDITAKKDGLTQRSNGATPALPGSRAEALRQQIRDAQLSPPEKEDSSKASKEEIAEGSLAPKFFNSRAEAEKHRREMRASASTANGDAAVRPEEKARPSGPDAKETDPEGVDFNSKVTIDMILTVVAECYGQKDLLRYRDIWVK
ncbi:hypothetical protein K491DRAFT_684501 [Lophiostoma macrostomum CBS 122681]|uniref:Uncharacterized protein n=1 Tax=Lophiostoma macrostomum CBS 122681 TaxID=1314788 RepID=A0A6A6SMH8_9PLEO|nr:hypothetical protein K491DRAFT_684501 [Lophiostoma macrostomum CBS 122681]